MDTVVIGRKAEKAILQSALTSARPELLVVYGRRRVGKTFLIRTVYKKDMRFEFTGMHKASMQDQLKNFHLTLNDLRKGYTQASDWLEAFHQLRDHITKIRSKKKKVIFLDEFPWLDSRRSRFLSAFDAFWNSFASKRTDIVVVICGSAASYMINKIIKNKGGLHNRITQRIQLAPFDLAETEQLLRHHGNRLSRYDVLRLYMAMGGIPHYLDKVLPSESVAQAIDRLCFRKNGFLRLEFSNVFASLFDRSENHESVVRALSSIRRGLTRSELIKKSKLPSGGTLSKTLVELEESGFIQRYTPYRGVKDSFYRLSDEYSMFYLKFIEKTKPSRGAYWLKLQNSPSYRSWSGFTFETVCMKHVEQIKKALGISGIHSDEASWAERTDMVASQVKKPTEGAQIDLLIDRDDHVINLCEMKFSNSTFTITKKYGSELAKKVSVFRESTATKKSLFVTMITTYGTSDNEHSRQYVQKSLTMDCLFEEL